MESEEKLERKLSPIGVCALACGCIIGWGAFVMPGNTFLLKGGPLGTAIAMAIAAIVMIIIVYNYQYMIQRYPVAGGEFTYADKAFGRTHGFICSWFLGLSYLAIVMLNGTALALIGRNLLNNVFQFGFHYSVAGYDIFLGEIILALVALIIVAILSIKGVNFAAGLQTILVFCIILGVVVVGVAALANPIASFANMEPAFAPDTPKIAGILAIVAVAPWAFVGFDTIPQSAEEYKFSSKKTKVLMIVSIIFGALVYIILNTVTASIVPEGYATWAEYVSDMPNLTGLMSLPTFYASYELLGTPGLVFLGIAVSGAILSGICGFFMATSRLLYSMSKSEVLPVWFGKLSKNKTPKNAIIFILICACIAPFFGRTALGWIVDMSSLGAAIGYGYTSLAAFKYAKAEGKTGIAVTGVLGTILSVCFMILLLVPIPMFNCSLGTESYICLVIWIVLGAIFYATARRKANKK